MMSRSFEEYLSNKSCRVRGKIFERYRLLIPYSNYKLAKEKPQVDIVNERLGYYE